MIFDRFDIRPDHHGWTVRDRNTARAASYYGAEQTGLRAEDADEMAYFLSGLWLPDEVVAPQPTMPSRTAPS